MCPKPALPVALALAAVTVALPARADEPERPETYDVGEYPPPSAQPSLLIVGAAVTATWYGAAVGMSYLYPDAPGTADLRIPVAGPWMALANSGCGDDPDCDTFEVVLRVILETIDGVGQAGGILAMLEAPFVPTATPRPPAPPTRTRPRPAAPPTSPSPSFQLRPVPMTAGGSLGLGVVGSF